MKKTFLFFLLVFSAGLVNARVQPPSNGNRNDSLPAAVRRADSIPATVRQAVKQQLQEENYTRIPDRDFENILDNKIAATADEKFHAWLTNIVLAIGLLGGILVFAGRQYLGKEISKELQEKTKGLEDELKKYITEELSDAKSFIEEAKQFIYREEYEKLHAVFKSGRYNMEDLTMKFQQLLAKVEKIAYAELVSLAVDDLLSLYYEQRLYNDCEKLVQTYSRSYELLATTWFNTALIYSNNYENYASRLQKDKCLEYLDRALLITPGWGEVQAIKLEIYMMDYLRSASEEEKAQSKVFAQNVLREINSGTSGASAYETLDRLTRDQKNNRYGRYASQVMELFPDLVTEMKAKSQEYSEKLKA